MNTKGNSRGRPSIHLNKYRYDEILGKYIRKKRYKHPVITVVELDPEQALLVACSIGGAYFHFRTGCPVRHATGAGCMSSVRGRRAPGVYPGSTASSPPS